MVASTAMSPTPTSLSLSKMTDKQAEALETMRSCLVCQLCDKQMTMPSTLLSCAHSFCHHCILKFTENSWTCPLMGCGTPVSMKGGSTEYIKKNHLITAVASSVQNIERIIATGPANWWVGQNEEGQTNGAVQFDDEEEVVDFQMMMDQDSNKRKHEEITSEEEDDDGSSTTKEFIIDDDIIASGRKTMSLDQSLFPAEDDAALDPKCAASPDFSCSPIAVQSSQPEPKYSPMPSIGEEDGRRTAPATAAISRKLDSALRPTARKSDQNSENVQRGEALRKSSLPKKKQPRSILKSLLPPNKEEHEHLLEPSRSKASESLLPLEEDELLTPTNRSPVGKKPVPAPKSGRAARVSFQQQPRVMLLNPSWTLSTAHTRCLRKCANDGSISMLRTHSKPFDNGDQFDSGFDFDAEEGRETFLAMLSSDQTSNRPPAPMSFYAISTERDANFTFGDEAITVPRSFPYYLAVACGLPIADIEFLFSAANRKKRGTASHQRYMFPSPPGANDERRHGRKNASQKEYLILGASNYSWGTPEKARAAALARHSLWQRGEGPDAQSETLLPGTGLLHGYSVLLLGFDQPNHGRRTVAKRKKRRNAELKGGGYCTHGNMSLLLQLCGANVYDINSAVTPKQIKKGLSKNHWTDIKNTRPLGDPENGPALDDALQLSNEKQGSISSHITVMVEDKFDSKSGCDFLKQLNSFAASMVEGEFSQIPMVSCQWLLDSIGDFEVKDMSEYDTAGTR